MGLNNPDSQSRKGDVRISEDPLYDCFLILFELLYTGTTALHDSCKYGYPEIAKLLIKHGADVELKDERGLSPLHVCMFGFHWMFLGHLSL